MGYNGHRHRKGSANMVGREIERRNIEERLPIAPPSEGVSYKDDGSIRMKDGKRESFCRKVASGVDPLEAWYVAFRDEQGRERDKRRQALTLKHREELREDVQKRIEWLKNYDVETKVTRRVKFDQIEQMMETARQRYLSEAKGGGSYQEGKLYLELKREHDAMAGDARKSQHQSVSINLDVGKILGSDHLKEMYVKLGITKQQVAKPVEGEVIDGTAD